MTAIMNDKLFKKVKSILESKFLVAPDSVKYSTGKKTYNIEDPNAIHTLVLEDKYAPAERNLRLFNPACATLDKKINLKATSPKEVTINYHGEEKRFFNLKPISSEKAIKNLNSEEKAYFGKSIDLENENQNMKVSVPVMVEVRLPIANRAKGFEGECDYNLFVKRFAEDMYESFLKVYTREERKTFKEKSSEYKPSEEKLKEIEAKYIKFMRGFDAMEIGYDDNSKLLMNYQGFSVSNVMDSRYTYQAHDVLLYVIPNKTAEEKEIFNLILEKMEDEIIEVCDKTTVNLEDEFDEETVKLIREAGRKERENEKNV